MSILESTRKMTTNEKMCYDMGYAQGKQDAAPVVRCRECRSYDATGFPALNPGTGWCDKMGKGVHNEFYCANGAKMESKA